MQIAKEAVENNDWPLFEVEHGVLQDQQKPKERKPIEPWLKQQALFRHLFKPGNEGIIEHIQAWIDSEWEKLVRLEEMRG